MSHHHERPPRDYLALSLLLLALCATVAVVCLQVCLINQTHVAVAQSLPIDVVLEIKGPTELPITFKPEPITIQASEVPIKVTCERDPAWPPPSEPLPKPTPKPAPPPSKPNRIPSCR